MKKRTNIFLTEIQIKKLRTISVKTGSSSGELVRQAINEYLERREKKKKE